MNHGIKPTPLDKRDYSYHRSFGAAVTKYPSELNLDDTGIFPDQNADALPFGCTGYTQSYNAGNRDHADYKPSYTYFKTCFMEGHPPNQGCDIRTSMKSTQVYGLQQLDENTDQDAETHRGGRYYNIYDDGGHDWFDSARIALLTEKTPLSAGSPWFPDWESTPDGILTHFDYDGSLDHYSWHNWSIEGWKQIYGEPYLLVKSWQGPDYGDHGWAYINRSVFNRVM